MENITIALKIHDFECSIEVINKKLGIDATESWLKGEIIPGRNGKILRRNSSWILKSSIENSAFINQAIIALLMSINYDELIIFSQKYLCELSIVMKCHNENNIGVNFDKEMLKRLTTLGVDLDLDIYMLPKKEA